jgi:hypothetical protein
MTPPPEKPGEGLGVVQGPSRDAPEADPASGGSAMAMVHTFATVALVRAAPVALFLRKVDRGAGAASPRPPRLV